eukprot:3665618-Amphidinium_carterae.1
MPDGDADAQESDMFASAVSVEGGEDVPLPPMVLHCHRTIQYHHRQFQKFHDNMLKQRRCCRISFIVAMARFGE